MKQDHSSFSEFFRFVRDFKNISAILGKASIFAPLADFLVNIGPPWPSPIVVRLFSCLVVVLVLAYSFEFWRPRSATIAWSRAIMRGGTVLAIVGFAGYLLLFSWFVVDLDNTSDQIIIGYKMHQDIAELVQNDPSRWTPQELILQFQDINAVWTPFSVNLMRWIILITWLAVWLMIAAVISAFVILRWRRARPHRDVSSVH